MKRMFSFSFSLVKVVVNTGKKQVIFIGQSRGKIKITGTSKKQVLVRKLKVLTRHSIEPTHMGTLKLKVFTHHSTAPTPRGL